MDLYLNNFTIIQNTDLLDINGGANVILIVCGVITIISALVGGGPLAPVGVFAGIVTIVAGIVW